MTCSGKWKTPLQRPLLLRGQKLRKPGWINIYEKLHGSFWTSRDAVETASGLSLVDPVLYRIKITPKAKP